MKLKKYIKIKNLSVILALGIFVSSVPLNSFASILSEDGRHETFEGNNININNVLEEDKVDIEIQGNTLVNIHPKYTPYLNVSGGNRDGYTIESRENYIKVVGDNPSLDWLYIHCGNLNMNMFKPNTTYTVVFSKLKGIDYIALHTGASTSPIANHIEVIDGQLAYVFNTYDQVVSNAQALYLGLRDTAIEVEVENPMIFEGDIIENLPKKYFSGMKSLGQDSKNESNFYDLTVTSYENKILNLDRGTVASSNGVPDDRTDRVRTNLFQVSSDLISIKGLSDRESSLVFCYDENKNYLGKVKDNWSTDRENIKLKENTKYVYVVWRIGDYVEIFPKDYKDVIIYENINNSYLQILLKEPLRSLPNGVQDKIIKKNGQWVIERNCGTVVLDGSNDEDWRIEPLTTDTLTKYVYYNFPSASSNLVVSNLAPFYEGDVHTPMVRVNHNVNRLVYISEVIGNISTQDVSKLKEWLHNNPLEVIYKLAQPTYEPIEFDSLQLYLDTTYISTNSTIPANLKVTVDRVANRAKEYSELAKSNPTIENISLARMWTNLMKESILKDMLQYSIDNITEVTNMTLERKKASANLDLYIKSENMLSMSLNTNVITLEDFSGIEDTTKENAVNISINSSLPYNLNAYLATDIQNSDKSNSMDLDILSIRENNELNYQKFSAINNKLILKSNCESGNNKQHNIDLKLNAGVAHEKDVYKTTIKFEAEQI